MQTKQPAYKICFLETWPCHVDALSVWSGKFVYIFPPFPLLNRCLQKLENNQTLALLIAPAWPTQVWWPRILSLLVINSLMLPQDKDLLTLPQSGTLHPLRNQMRLLACLLSGNTMKQEEYRSQLLDCSWHPDEEVLRNSTPVHQKMDSILSPKENQSSSTTCRSSLGFSFLNFLIKDLLRVLSNVLEMHCLLMCFGRWLCIWTEPTSFTSVERCFMIMQSRPPRPKYTEVCDVQVVLTYLATLHPVESLGRLGMTFTANGKR